MEPKFAAAALAFVVTGGTALLYTTNYVESVMYKFGVPVATGIVCAVLLYIVMVKANKAGNAAPTYSSAVRHVRNDPFDGPEQFTGDPVLEDKEMASHGEEPTRAEIARFVDTLEDSIPHELDIGGDTVENQSAVHHLATAEDLQAVFRGHDEADADETASHMHMSKIPSDEIVMFNRSLDLQSYAKQPRVPSQRVVWPISEQGPGVYNTSDNRGKDAPHFWASGYGSKSSGVRTQQFA